MMLAGVGAAFYSTGFSGVLQGFFGAVTGLLLFGWIFALRFMGGGDVKFLMAMGVWGGPAYVAQVALLSILIGSGFGLIQLILKNQINSFLHRMSLSMWSLIHRGTPFQAPDLDRQLTLPFGVPLAIAAVWVAYRSPLSGGLP